MPKLFLTVPDVGATRLALAAAAVVVAAGCHDESTSPKPQTLASLVVEAGDQQSAPVGTATPQPIIFLAKDQNGNPMQNVDIVLRPSDGSIGADSTVTTTVEGEVAVAWTLGTAAKTDTLIATVPSASSITPLTIVATATPGPAAQLVVVSGNDQTATAGSALGAPLVVQVQDAFGNPVPGATVTFADDMQGTFGAVTLTTDANGDVSDTLTLPASAGTDDITVTIAGPDGPVTATLEEVAT
ncbi:MAG TPA: Ig-like domain-containing protein, partial [Gemmatimonadaceae bacterium]|nr:Ig-like domain-containing protein [Gemmatimonadaceae bacterium]